MMSTAGTENPFFHRLLRDRRGNFGMMTAIMLPVMIGGAGVAVDTTNMVLYRSQLQEATDAGALAVATALARGMDRTAAEQLGKDFTAGQMANYISGDPAAMSNIKSNTGVDIVPGTSTSATATGTTVTTSYSAQVTSAYDMPLNGMTRLLTGNAWTSVTLSTSSTSTSSTSTTTANGNSTGTPTNTGPGTSTGTNTTDTAHSLSLYLVLDRSGSMGEATDTINAAQPTKTQTTTTKVNAPCANNPKKTCTTNVTTTTTVNNYYTKMEALKIAVTNLTGQLNKSDPNMQYVRTGADSYSTYADTASSLAWGTTAAMAYVNKLSASGTTDSSGAFIAAYNALTATSPSEESLHEAKTPGAVLTKTIVFMTDGANNVNNATTTTLDYCNRAKNAGIQIYTIALMAPPDGQALLKACATTQDKFYFDAQNASDLVKAFETIGAAATHTEVSDTPAPAPETKQGAVRLTQ